MTLDYTVVTTSFSALTFAANEASRTMNGFSEAWLLLLWGGLLLELGRRVRAQWSATETPRERI